MPFRYVITTPHKVAAIKHLNAYLTATFRHSHYDFMPTTPSTPETLLKQRVWAGRIPVVFSLDPHEVTTLHAPRPFYVCVASFANSEKMTGVKD